MNESRGEEVSRCPACPVCHSRHVARAVVLDGEYRCPDCSAVFDGDGRIVADPRPWVVSDTTTNRWDTNRRDTDRTNGINRSNRASGPGGRVERTEAN